MQPMINALLDPVVNFGKVTVSTGYGSIDTVVTLITGDGAKLPNPATDGGSFNLVWFNNSIYSDPADDPYVEIVRCTSRDGDVLTIMRGQEGKAASNKNIPTKIYKMILSPTKKTIDDIQTESLTNVSTHSVLSTGIHGIGIDTIDGVSARNTAIGTAIDTHKNLITGVHGVTGSYILGTEDIGVINGIAGLDSSGKVPISQLPALALTNVYTVVSEVDQLALFTTTQEGDVAIRTDQNKSYVRNAGVSGTMADWSLLLTPTDTVLSVFGRTGAVAATTNDYTWAQINKATSSIADITTRSHTSLTDIGTYNHATIDSHMTSATGIHGVTGAVVGTSDAQALTNKTIKTTVGLQLPVGTNLWVT